MPWPAMIGFGLAVLGLAPRDFWTLSPRELAHAARFLGGGERRAPRRADLDALMAMFPDREKSDGFR